MGTQLVWLKRDLRVEDHAPLAAATRTGPTLVVYVFEPSLWARPEMDPSHFCFIEQSLREVAGALRARGGELLIRGGELPEVFDQLHLQYGFEAIHAHEETGLEITYARDRAVHRWCRQNSVTFHEYPQFGVFRPHPSREGWAGRWEARMRQRTVTLPEEIPVPPNLETPEGFPEPEALKLGENLRTEAQPGGALAGAQILESFLDARGEDYRFKMSSPLTAKSSCSRLSPHIAFGTMSLRRIYQASVRRRQKAERRGEAAWAASLEAFEGRLRWHCHFIQKLEDEPEIEHRNAHRGYDGLRTEDPADWTLKERDRFEAWRTGRTGFPMVDAAMRCLHRTGWINFRMRAMLASFACHHLWLHWRAPAVALAPMFLDFEPGIHFSQFQMQAGTTGINTTRIYNVVKQAEDQDPQGLFIRQYLPELSEVPSEYLSAPYRMPASVQERSGCRIGRHYPAPIVDH